MAAYSIFKALIINVDLVKEVTQKQYSQRKTISKVLSNPYH